MRTITDNIPDDKRYLCSEIVAAFMRTYIVNMPDDKRCLCSEIVAAFMRTKMADIRDDSTRERKNLIGYSAPVCNLVPVFILQMAVVLGSRV